MVKTLLWTAISTAVGGLVAGLLGVAAGLSGGVGPAVTLRGTFTLAAVFLAGYLIAARARRAGVPDPARLVVVGALIGFAADPMTWAGRTALGQLLADPGVVTTLVDLLCWLGVAGLAALIAGRRVATPAPAPTPYG